MLNEARKKVEGMKRNIPYSYEKAQQLGILLFWKTKLRQANEIPVDENSLQRRITMYNIEVPEVLTIEFIKEKVEEAQQRWKDLKEEGQVLREKFLLDHSPKLLNSEECNNKLKNRMLQSVKKSFKRKSDFKYLTKHAGKGVKTSLKRVHEVNQNNEIIQTHTEKEAIEQIIFNHNKNHYREACNTPMYKDKIYQKLQQDDTRDTILDGNLDPSECDNEDVYKFLSLLK